MCILCLWVRYICCKLISDFIALFSALFIDLILCRVGKWWSLFKIIMNYWKKDQQKCWIYKRYVHIYIFIYIILLLLLSTEHSSVYIWIHSCMLIWFSCICDFSCSLWALPCNDMNMRRDKICIASFESLCLHRTVHVRDIDYTLWFCSVFILVSNIIAIIHTVQAALMETGSFCLSPLSCCCSVMKAINHRKPCRMCWNKSCPVCQGENKYLTWCAGWGFCELFSRDGTCWKAERQLESAHLRSVAANDSDRWDQLSRLQDNAKRGSQIADRQHNVTI